MQNEKIVWKEPGSYHLIDVAEPSRLTLNLSIPANLHYNKIIFNLGIDSLTNEAGAGNGDLDAVNGMYWAWQSGYINFKLEGAHPLCATRKHAFQFHLGGFRGNNYCMRQIQLPVKDHQNIYIEADVLTLLSTIDLAKQNTIMIPGPEARDLSIKAAAMFRIKK